MANKLKRTTVKKPDIEDIEALEEVPVISDTIDIYKECKDKVTIRKESDCIPTGITLLNLFLSNNKLLA